MLLLFYYDGFTVNDSPLLLTLLRLLRFTGALLPKQTVHPVPSRLQHKFNSRRLPTTTHPVDRYPQKPTSFFLLGQYITSRIIYASKASRGLH